jgi:glucan 1,3-beta-glucosidase
MVNNQANTHKAAPDKGSMDGPILTEANLTALIDHKPGHPQGPPHPGKRASDFWMDGISHGSMPLAPSGYQFYRNVHDFGAKGDGKTDDTEAINRAVAWYSTTDSTLRCGKGCGSSTTLGALVYFPSGTYLISTPVIQYYYTQFVGDANSRPVIKGTFNFTGIALIDTDVYIPGGNGSEWYINQNQFFRQIRNFVFDMTAMNWTNTDNGQLYVPTGIHWQVAQATSLQNLYFNMPVSTATQSATAVGVFMENGSGGFLSDLVFFGGNIGFRAGSQQYTARSLHFTSCLTAISSIWNWGFVWKDIYVLSCYVAIDCTSVGGLGNQGTGSITVLDSHFSGVPYPITLRNGGPYPNIILDNLVVDNSASVVLISGGATIFAGSSSELYFESWAMGMVCDSLSTGQCTYRTGLLNPAPNKPQPLLNSSGTYFTRSRPQYENNPGFVVATANGVKNDGKSDQSSAINSLLSGHVGSVIFFPAGIYLVTQTVFVPVGSILVGEGWSQVRLAHKHRVRRETGS